MLSFKELKRSLKSVPADFPELKLAVLGDTATQLLVTALGGTAVSRGYKFEVFEADYNQVERQVLDSSSEFHTFAAEYTVVFQSSQKLLERFNSMTPVERISLADERLTLVRTICGSCTEPVIYYNYPEIDDTVFGSYANRQEESFTFQIRKLNYELMRLSSEIHNLYICDIAGLQNKFGRDFFFDPAVYVSTDMVLSLDALPYVASRTFDIICSLEGKFRKCLILDLDNTLWGGVVGDDGWENLQIGHGLGIGKAYTEFQEWVRKLRQRGIIVCICSRNDEFKAREAFERNPEMILKLDDISVFVANWNDKDENIRLIKEVLNIGFDSMVFLDDNPFERNLVKESIPGICVPELPEDPALYLEHLYSLNLFETTSYSQTDSDRTWMYQVESQRAVSAKSYSCSDDFLRSLDMMAAVSGFNQYNIPRVAQLTQRSNQFNLRTVRYNEEQIKDIGSCPDYKGFAFTLSDRFGDNGLVSVVILKTIDGESGSVFVDTWLMSCRVLKRGLEYFVLNTVVDWCRGNGYSRIIGEYLPTSKNGMVADFYPSAGFSAVAGHEGRRWSLDVEHHKAEKCHINLKDNDI